MGARQSQTRHVYNNCGRDIQLYLVAACIEPESSRVQSESAVDDDLSLSKQALIGTVLSGSSKSITVSRSMRRVIVVCEGVAGIRDLPESKDIVVEATGAGVAGLELSSFSSLHHVDLPSILMNMDALLPPTTPRFDSKAVLNRTLSTAVPSPTSSPSRQLTDAAPEEAARAACVIASCLRGWRHSCITMSVREVKSSVYQSLVVFRPGRSVDCILVVDGLAFSLDPLDIDWPSVRLPVELCDEALEMCQSELYAKVVAGAKAVLGSDLASEVPRLVSIEETDISTVLAGAVLLSDCRDAGL